jgi:hypothetical protein
MVKESVHNWVNIPKSRGGIVSDKKIEIVKGRFIVGLVLFIIGLIKIHDYKITGCLASWTTPNVCGAEAVYYYYLYIVFLAIGLILFLTSFRKKKNVDGGGKVQ